MRYVTDTSAFLAVALHEPERPWLIQATKGHDLVAPAVLPYEIGNALSALVKRKAIRVQQLSTIWDTVTRVPVELALVDIQAALLLACEFRVYAYDAYFLQCALETRCPLLTLDGAMRQVAKALNIAVLERT